MPDLARQLVADVGQSLIDFAKEHPDHSLEIVADDRFVDMIDAYDPELTGQLLAAARKSGIDCHAGVYIWFCGPSFETPAEIRAYARLGGDAVGMSTVPEVIVARHCGLRVAALSVITNFAAGLGDSAPHGHAETLSEASKAATNVGRLLTGFLEEYAQGTEIGRAHV